MLAEAEEEENFRLQELAENKRISDLIEAQEEEQKVIMYENQRKTIENELDNILLGVESPLNL